MSRRSDLEEGLVFAIHAARLPEPERQYRAVEGRRWAWDFAWPSHMLLLEVDGGTWSQGRHNTGTGIEGDAEKQSVAAALGWRTMRVTGKMIDSGRAVELLEGALGVRPVPTSLPLGPLTRIEPRRAFSRP